MKTIEITAYGAPEEVAHCIDAPTVGDPGPGEVVFDVLAFPINPADISFCRGSYRLRPPLPATPGAEGLGRELTARHPLVPAPAQLRRAADELRCPPGLELHGVGARVRRRVHLPVGELRIAVVRDAGLGDDEDAHARNAASRFAMCSCVRSVASTVAPPRWGRTIRFSCSRA